MNTDVMWTAFVVTRFQMKLAAVVAICLAIVFVVLLFFMRKRAAEPDGAVTKETDGANRLDETAAAESKRPKDALERIHAEMAVSNTEDPRTSETLFNDAVRTVTSVGGVAVLVLQKRLHVDFDQAKILIDRLEDAGFVSGQVAGKQRKVLPAAFEFVEKLDATLPQGASDEEKYE